MVTHIGLKFITDRLFVAEGRRLNGYLIELNTKNKQLKDTLIDGFIYGGKYYQPREVTLWVAAFGQARTPLHRSLQGEMENYLTDKKSVDDERKLITQTLYTLLAPCRTNQQIRDALPECLLDCFEGVSNLPRSQEVGFTLRDNPRALRQFEKILPRIEIYSVARLLY